MFDQLVESTAHHEDSSRKGWFLLGTFALYFVLFGGLFVFAIDQYDRSLTAQNMADLKLIANVATEEPAPVKQEQQKEQPKPEKVEITKNVDVRKELIADVSRADLVPKTISAKASDVPPVRKGVVTMVGSSNSNAIAPIAPGAGTGNILSAGPAKVEVKDEPPPPVKPPPHAPISGGVLNGKAIHLVQPQYPAMARTAIAGWSKWAKAPSMRAISRSATRCSSATSAAPTPFRISR